MRHALTRLKEWVALHSIETRDENFIIRFAEKKDTALILRFIKELASYEEELSKVTATEKVLMGSLFERHEAEVIIGEYQEKPIGFALFHHNFSTFLGKAGIHLVDLYIIPQMRGNGFGRKILSYLAHLTVERQCERLEWWCHDWNERAIKLYKKLGAFPLDELKIYRLKGDALDNLSNDYLRQKK